VAAPPFTRHVGLTVESAGAGVARLRLPWREQHTQEVGVLQGGYLALLADAAVFAAGQTLLKPGEGLTTIELKTNFLAPVRGQDVIAEAAIVKRGRTIVLGEVSLRVPSGELVGKSLVTYMVLPPRDDPTRHRRTAGPSSRRVSRSRT
jgi:uncharacterized protein (TIGR00369 family)